jgi:hypothetical protein
METAGNGLPPEAQLELIISFLEKRTKFGHRPSSIDRKTIGDLAVKAGQLSLAAEYLSIVCKANGEAVFPGFTRKMAFGHQND